MAKSAPETILLVGTPNRRQREAAGTITPGDLIELTTSNTVQRHSVEDGRHARMVAVENDIVGDGITVDYSSGEVVQYNVFRPGDEAYLRLAPSQTAVVGSYLSSKGAGTVKVESASSTTDLEGSLVAMALEAVTTTGTASRIKVLIL